MGERRLKACLALASHMLAFYFVPSFLVALLVTSSHHRLLPPLSVTLVVVESSFYYLYIYSATSGPRPVVLQRATVLLNG